MILNIMTLFVKDKIKSYYIHIPRTGGRYTKKVFEENGYESHHDDCMKFIYGISIMHLQYPLYEFLQDVPESTQFTIIRDPFTRFCSAVGCIAIDRGYGNDFYANLESEEFFNNFLAYENMVHHYHNNWFRPQHEFLSEKTHIYKFENKLGKNFIDWLNEIIGDNLEHKEYTYYGAETELNPNRWRGSEGVRKNIETYYSKDYELLGY